MCNVLEESSVKFYYAFSIISSNEYGESTYFSKKESSPNERTNKQTNANQPRLLIFYKPTQTDKRKFAQINKTPNFHVLTNIYRRPRAPISAPSAYPKPRAPSFDVLPDDRKCLLIDRTKAVVLARAKTDN